MTAMHYDGRKFRSIDNSANGEVDTHTVFHYSQQDELVWATYQGGSIRRGMLLAKVDADGCLDMRYQHINIRGELMTGICHSTPEILPDGRIRLHEEWQWTCGDYSKGHSQVEEF